MHIAASDFAGHVKTLDLQVVRRGVSSIERQGSEPATPCPRRPYPNTWALFVGVDHYPQMITAPPLHYAGSDMQRLTS